MIRKKQTIIAISAAMALIIALSVFSIAGKGPVYGDVDLDGRILLSDAMLIFRYCDGNKELSDSALANADVNRDGKVTRADGIIILQYVVGTVKKLPVENGKYEDLAFINDTFPENSVRLSLGEAYSLRGRVVSCTPLLQVRVVITDVDSDTREVDESVKFSASENVFEYDIHSSSPSLDGRIKFGQLKNGKKTIRVYATDLETENELLFTGKFTVGFSRSELSGFVFNKNDDKDNELLYEVLDYMNDLDLDSVGGKIVSEAVKRLGTSHTELDCSKFTQAVYKKAIGLSLPGTAAEQARYCMNGDYNIDFDSLKTGDLIFWVKKTCDCGRYNEIHHCAIYLGRVSGVDILIESVTSQNKVLIRPIWGEDNNTWKISFAARPR